MYVLKFITVWLCLRKKKKLFRIEITCSVIKVRKMAKIRNRYNQAPHLTQDTNGKVTTSQLDIINESQKVRGPRGINKQTRTKVFLFVLFCCLTSQVNSNGHGGTVSSPNHTFFLGKLEQAVNQYFVHILPLVTDNNSSLMIQRKGGE